jgi:glycosyltransferase involved in cell wall biosynthesis
MDRRPVALIPAYRPEPDVIDMARNLVASDRFRAVVVVDDGSPADSRSIFESLRGVPGVVVLSHYTNLGKGAALKTGLNYIGCHYGDAIGAVTVDADGQHVLDDVLAVAARLQQTPDALVLGCREFQSGVPLRSRLGNVITRGVMRVIGGLRLRDTQTGLRAIPRMLFSKLLRLSTSGYDFELDMLLHAGAERVRIHEVPITTVYIDGNRSSHFDPLLDSLKIYLVFLRFNLSSLLAAVIDYAIFASLYLATGALLSSQLTARAFSGTVNYTVNRKFVFKSDRSHMIAFALYALTVVLMGLCSYALIRLFESTVGLTVYAGKVVSEGLLYVASFTVQREIIFTRRSPAA